MACGRLDFETYCLCHGDDVVDDDNDDLLVLNSRRHVNQKCCRLLEGLYIGVF